MKVMSASVVALVLLSVGMSGVLKAAQKDDRIPVKPPVELRQDAFTSGMYDTLTESPMESSEGASADSNHADAQIVWVPVS